MGLKLFDAMYKIRLKLGEGSQNFWSDEELIYDVNRAAQDLCSAAQNLETVIQFPWPNKPGTTVPMQETALPVNVDRVFAAGVFSGQFFQLEEIQDPTQVQVANRVGTIPQLFYIRTDSTVMSPQGSSTNTGDMTLIQLAQATGTDYQTVMGVWPVPQQNYDTTVWCTRHHPFVINPLDPIAVPNQFFRVLCAYVLAESWEKRGQDARADRQWIIYNEGKKEFCNWSAERKYLKTFPTYGGTAWPTLARGSSSVIFLDQNPGLINQ